MFCLCFRESPKFAQLYFFDPSATVRAEGRAGIFGLDANPRVLRILLRVLENVIVSSNSYYARFLIAVNVARDLESKGLPLPPEGDLIRWARQNEILLPTAEGTIGRTTMISLASH